MRRHSRRAFVASGATLVLVALVGNESQAQSASAGFSVSGSAAGVGILYNRVGILPLDPIADVAIPRVTVSLDSSPSASAGSAPVDPGSLRTAPGAVSSLLGLPFSLPSVPGTAVADYPAGPAQAEFVRDLGAPLDPLSASAFAEEEAVGAAATVGALEGPSTRSGSATIGMAASAADRARLVSLRRELAGVLGSGRAATASIADDADLVFAARGLSSEAVVNLADGAITASFTSRIAELSLLGGVIRVSGVRSQVDLEWPAGEEEPAVEHVADLGTVTVLGVPAKLTQDGIEVANSLIALPVAETFDQLLGERGGRLAVGGVERKDSSILVEPLTFEFDGEIQPGEVDHVRLTFGRIAMNFTRENFSFGGDAVVDGAGDDEVALPAGPTPDDEVALPAGPTPTGSFTDGAILGGGAGGDLALPGAGAPSSSGGSSGPGASTGGAGGGASGADIAELFANVVKRPPLIGFFVVAGAIGWFLTLVGGRFGMFTPSNVEP